MIQLFIHMQNRRQKSQKKSKRVRYLETMLGTAINEEEEQLIEEQTLTVRI